MFEFVHQPVVALTYDQVKIHHTLSIYILYMFENNDYGSLMRCLTQLQLPNPLHQGLQVTHAFDQDSLQNSQVQLMSYCTHPKVSEQKLWFLIPLGH